MRKSSKLALSMLICIIVLWVLMINSAYGITEAEEYVVGENMYYECVDAFDIQVIFTDNLSVNIFYDTDALYMLISKINVIDMKLLIQYAKLVPVKNLKQPVYNSKMSIDSFALSLAKYTVHKERLVILAVAESVLDNAVLLL